MSDRIPRKNIQFKVLLRVRLEDPVLGGSPVGSPPPPPNRFYKLTPLHDGRKRPHGRPMVISEFLRILSLHVVGDGRFWSDCGEG